MDFNPFAWQNFLTVAAGFGAAFLVTLWVSLIIWTWRDITNRTADRAIRVLAILTVALLFVGGWLIYLVLRPHRTLEEDFQRSLEEEALLQSIEDNALCPGCGRHIQEEWIACPNCYTLLKKSCQRCGKSIDLSWKLCPFCGTPAAELQRANMVGDKGFTMIPGEEPPASISVKGK